MNENPRTHSTRKDRTAAWISGHPLISVTAAALIAFLLGVGAGGADRSEQTVVDVEPASSSVDQIERELADVETELKDAEDEVLDMRSQNTLLRERLSSRNRMLRKLRASLSELRTELSEARAAAVSQSEPEPEPEPAAGSGSGCDSNYSGTCVPVVSYDLNCDDISGSVTVVGSDIHGFDGDGDGSGCE